MVFPSTGFRKQYLPCFPSGRAGEYCLCDRHKGKVRENLYSYDAFSSILESREDITNRILYTGQQYDKETGQYYLRARYYNPVIGRFTQEDTYRGDGLNLYAYCANNPVMYYDPSGHDKATQTNNTPKSTPAGEIDFEGGSTSGKTNFIVSPNGIVVDANINVSSIPETQFTDKNLQHEFKHASDFGITGNWNKSNAVEYQQAIESYVDSDTDTFISKY